MAKEGFCTNVYAGHQKDIISSPCNVILLLCLLMFQICELKTLHKDLPRVGLRNNSLHVSGFVSSSLKLLPDQPELQNTLHQSAELPMCITATCEHQSAQWAVMEVTLSISFEANSVLEWMKKKRKNTQLQIVFYRTLNRKSLSAQRLTKCDRGVL